MIEMIPLMVGSIALMFFWFGYPILTLAQCWKDKEQGRTKKVVWTLFIVVTWLLLAIGSIIYGLVKYKSWHKALPLVIAVILFGGVTAFSLDTSRIQGFIGKQLTTVVEAQLENSVQDRQVRERLSQNIQTLKQERSTSPEALEKNAQLMTFLTTIIQDDLNEQELAIWDRLYKNRKDISKEALQKFVSEYALQNSLKIMNEAEGDADKDVQKGIQ